MRVWRTGNRFDSQWIGGYSPLDFALFDGVCWASLETEDEGDVYAAPHRRWTTARRRIRDPAAIRERLAVKVEAGGTRCRE
jgi:hypothetical protein